MSWSGQAYIDSNLGDEPLADAFRDWSWSRTIEKSRTRVYYDMTRKDGSAHDLAVSFDRDRAEHVAPPPKQSLGRTRWLLPLEIRSETSDSAGKVAAWEDGPFYARSLIQHQIEGERTMSVHERLSLTRFERSWVLALLPFRMPRWTF